jgi:DNA-binding LacI/PurR family transcriptional regulator
MAGQADAAQPDRSSALPGRSRIRDIARLAAVSESTVSRALTPDPNRPVARATADRIRRIASELGYQPNLLAMGLRRGQSRTIGLMIPDITDAYNGYVVRGIQDEAESRGFSVLIMEDRDDRSKRRRTIDQLVSRQVDAMIVMTARTGDEKMFFALSETVPVVLCLQDLPGSGIPSITTDDELGGRLAAGYLARLGHKVVCQLVCDPTIACFEGRQRGFDETAAELGLEVVNFPHFADAPSFKDGRDLASLLLATGAARPTGLFVHTDLMAIGAIGALQSAGLRCPDDMSVVSFDASVIGSYFRPELTTIGVPAYDIGRRTGATALDAAEGAKPAASYVFSPGMVPGASSRAVSAS